MKLRFIYILPAIFILVFLLAEIIGVCALDSSDMMKPPLPEQSICCQVFTIVSWWILIPILIISIEWGMPFLYLWPAVIIVLVLYGLVGLGIDKLITKIKK